MGPPHDVCLAAEARALGTVADPSPGYTGLSDRQPQEGDGQVSWGLSPRQGLEVQARPRQVGGTAQKRMAMRLRFVGSKYYPPQKTRGSPAEPAKQQGG